MSVLLQGWTSIHCTSLNFLQLPESTHPVHFEVLLFFVQQSVTDLQVIPVSPSVNWSYFQIRPVLSDSVPIPDRAALFSDQPVQQRSEAVLLPQPVFLTSQLLQVFPGSTQILLLFARPVSLLCWIAPVQSSPVRASRLQALHSSCLLLWSFLRIPLLRHVICRSKK